ncbi:ribbon-helix-helix domain-containing protein [Helicobacter sp. MIT 21-1697]|uniref:ribbon-helix-helix domain-containing protein n=1 Tax=Helicobacter sp. MIT 21-1697 TaxID=2993733 RepID=UPI00224B7B6B|nr:ribbon-helix-helix domain-containing protein [Helicobacter sp. MIT 21-1697]MCX2716813.1 ribbon-helix-helix domain-containing protein [Helicobacter sp. MIT 21-1697]
MKYTTKKLEQINKIESNKQAQALSNNIKDKDFAEEQKGNNRRNFTFTLDENLIKEIDEFLNEFGERKESKNKFVEDALRSYFAQRKAHIKTRLLEKIEKLNQY